MTRPGSASAAAARRGTLGGVRRRSAGLACALLAGVLLVAPAGAREPVEIGRFAPTPEDSVPAGWEALVFPKVPRRTRYTVVRDGERWVLRAESRAAASGLYRPLDLDPKVYRILTWRWKVENILATADARRKEGDDYPARVYVAFRYDPDAAPLLERARFGLYRALYGRYPPKAVINYIWDNRLPPGTTLDNAYSDRAKMVVVRSGAAEVGRWLLEARHVYEDYRRLFGEEPPRIAGVALMTDTDDTGENAVAWYDALTLRPVE
jgi:hypothetical protein